MPYRDRSKYWEESWRLKRTCCHSISLEKPSANAGMKNLKRTNNYNDNNTTKWYMHKPESIQDNETHKILWDFEIQTDYLIPARRPDLVIIRKKKRTCSIVNFAALEDHKVKIKESVMRDKYLHLPENEESCET